MAGGRNPELPRRSAVRDPLVDPAVADQLAPGDPDPLAVERMRAQAARPKRVVDHGDAAREDLIAEPVLEETCAAGNARSGDRAGKMIEQAGGNTRIEQHRIAARLGAARIEPGDGAVPGALPDDRRRIEVSEEARAVPGIIALHGCAFAGDDRGAAAVAAGAIGASEPVRGRQRDGHRRRTRADPAGVGDPGHAKRRALGLERPGAKLGGIGTGGVEAVDGGRLAKFEQVGRSKACKRVFGRFASHCKTAIDDNAHAFERQVRGCDAGRALAEEQAQADAFALGRTDILQFAHADFDRGRAVTDIDSVGGGRARCDGAVDQ